MKPSILVTRRIPEAGLSLLQQECAVEINEENRSLSKQEIMSRLEGKQALLCLLTDNIDTEIIASNSQLKVIANYAAGYNNIDVAAATRLKIAVTNTPGILTEATADMTWALLLGVSRRVVEGDRMVRQGEFRGWEPMLLLGAEVSGQTLGIVGFGRIGQAVARRAAGFNMKIFYYSRNRAEPSLERELSSSWVELDTLLERSDFISLHCPLSAETHHLIDAKRLALMKRTAIIVNTSRGPVIDEQALASALRDKQIAGAGLDVYEREPGVTSVLLELPQVILAPHLGSATLVTREKMAKKACQSLLDVLSGLRSPQVVNPEIYA